MERTVTTTPTLQEAAQALAARNLDWAFEQNAVGYNKADSSFGAQLAAVPESEWDDEIKRQAWEMLRKYRNQLSNYGIDFDAIPEPAEVGDRYNARTTLYDKQSKAKARDTGKIEQVPGGYRVSFPYNADLVARVKEITGRRYDGTTKTWFVPESADALLELARFSADTGVQPDSEEFAARLEGAAMNYTPKPAKRIEAENGNCVVHFPFDRALVAAIRAVPGARWDNDRKVWTAEVSGPLGLFADEHGFHVDDALRARLTGAAEVAKARVAASLRQDGTIVIDGLGAILHPFQRAGVEYALDARRTIIGDEMGLGKTPQALATAKAADKFPVLAVVPNRVKVNWLKEVDFWLPGRSVTLIDNAKKKVTFGRIRFKPEKRAEFETLLAETTDEGERDRIEFILRQDAVRQTTRKRTVATNDYDADVIVVNYDLLSKMIRKMKDADGKYVMTGKKKNKHVYEVVPGSHLDEILKRKPQTLTVDESQHVKNYKAQRTIALDLIGKGIRKDVADALILLLSGTAILNRPNELVTQLDLMDQLASFGGFWGFVKRYCGAYDQGYGLDTSGATNLGELNERLRQICYVRRDKRDVLTELPPVQRATVELPITNRAEYKRAEADVVAWVRETAAADKEFIESIADLDEEEQANAVSDRKHSAAAKAMRAELLVRMNALRQLTGIGKIAAIKEWVTEYLDESRGKLIIFAHHHPVQEALLAAFPDAAKVMAEDTTEKSQVQVDRFQNDPGCRLIIISLMAGSFGLTLTEATDVAFAELPWRPTDIDQAEGRAYGRLNDAHGINSYYLVGEETFDGDMAELLDAKRDVTDQVNSGKKGASGVGILAALTQRLIGRNDLAEAA